MQTFCSTYSRVADGTKFFLKHVDSILLKQRDKSSQVDFAKHDIMSYSMEIVS